MNAGQPTIDGKFLIGCGIGGDWIKVVRRVGMSGRPLPYGLAEVGVGAVPVVNTVGDALALPATSGVEARGSSGEDEVDCDCSGEEVTRLSLGRLRGEVGDALVAATGSSGGASTDDVGGPGSDAASTTGSARPGDTAEGGGVGNGAGSVGGVETATGRGSSSGLGVGIWPLGLSISAALAGPRSDETA